MSQIKNKFLAQMATLTLKGNNTGSTANPQDLTVAQVNAILPVFTSTLNGLAPLSGGGTTNFLRADGTWAAPSVSFSGLNTDGIIYATSATAVSSTAAGSQYQSMIANSSGAPSFQALALNQSAAVSGILAIANGGTGTSTAPTQYGVIYASSTTAYSSTAAGSSGQVLTSNGTSAPTFQAVSANFKTPTTQVFTSSGTYTPSSGVLYSIVKIVGAGGGGSGSGTASGGNGGTGGNSTFGSLLTAGGGAGGSWQSGSGAVGGNPTVTSPALDAGSVTGGKGGCYGLGAISNQYNVGGNGGNSALGGGAGIGVSTNAGSAGVDGTGGGGAGAGGGNNSSNFYAGNGGGAGGYVEAIYPSPASQTVTIGAAGTAGSAGSNGFAGGAGGKGYCVVIEYYQ